MDELKDENYIPLGILRQTLYAGGYKYQLLISYKES